MKTVTFRLPVRLVSDIDGEAKRRRVTRSDVVRERLAGYGTCAPPARVPPSFRDQAADLIGSVGGDGLPTDLATRTEHYLKTWGYGQKRDRR